MSNRAAEVLGRTLGRVALLRRDEAGADHALALTLAYKNVEAILIEELRDACRRGADEATA